MPLIALTQAQVPKRRLIIFGTAEKLIDPSGMTDIPAAEHFVGSTGTPGDAGGDTPRIPVLRV